MKLKRISQTERLKKRQEKEVRKNITQKTERMWKESKEKQLWKDRGRWTGLVLGHQVGLSKAKQP
jgi:hypothetical protein